MVLVSASLRDSRRQAESPSIAPQPTPTIRILPTAAPPPAPTAIVKELAEDTVFVGGTVITEDAQGSIAQAVAVMDGLIQAVGSEKDIRALVGARTAVRDLKGATLTPGIVDPHDHAQVTGMMGSIYVPMMPPEVKDVKTLQAKVAETVARTPKGQLVQGYFLGL